MVGIIEPMVSEQPRRKRRKLAGQTSITVDSIAGYCMVSRSTVRRWIREGMLSAMKLPSGHFRVSIADFMEFLKRFNMPVPEELRER